MKLNFKVLLKQASYVFTGNIGVAIIAFLQSIIVVRALGPSDYGVYGTITAFAVLIQTFFGFRTNEPLTKQLVKYRLLKHASFTKLLIWTTMLTDLSTRIIGFSIYVLLASTVGHYFTHADNLAYVFYVYGLTIILGFVDNTLYCIAREQRRFRLIATVPLIINIIQTGLVFILWHIGELSLNYLSWIYVISASFRFMINSYNINKIGRYAYEFNIMKVNWLKLFVFQRRLKDFWNFMWSTYFSSLATSLVKNGDIIILGYHTTPDEVGLYKLAKHLTGIVQQLGAAMGSVIYQDFNELLQQGQIKEVKMGLYKISRIWTPFILLGTIIGLLISSPVIIGVYGVSYTGAVLPFNILLMGAVVTTLLFWVQPITLAMGQQRFYLKYVSIVCIITTVLMIIVTRFNPLISLSIIMTTMWITVYFGFFWRALRLLKLKGA